MTAARPADVLGGYEKGRDPPLVEYPYLRQPDRDRRFGLLGLISQARPGLPSGQ